MFTILNRRSRAALALVSATALLAAASGALAAEPPTASIVHNVQEANERLTMTVHTSRILTLEKNIPRVQVNNPKVVDVTALSAKQIQVHAMSPGITQINLWTEQGQIHSIDVVVMGDVQELFQQLRVQFPNSAINVYPTSTSVILKGFVDNADDLPLIVDIAKDYTPKVINNIQVAGGQQVLLHVRVMEVSRTKLRDFGFDFANVSGNGDFALSSISGLLSSATATSVTSTGADTFAFGIIGPNNSFFGLLTALQRNSLAKVLAEPTLVALSGRPASFLSGGEVPVPIPQGLGSVTIEYRKYGTQVDFVPFVRGNGTIRLEVRPRVSELDRSVSITLGGADIPGFTARQVDTGVEMKAGQTLAIAGLIQERIEATKDGFPVLGDLPYINMAFSRKRETRNTVETLVLVRPELAEALDPEEVPPCGPGLNSRSPTDCELYVRGHIEVPKNYPPGGKHAMSDDGYIHGEPIQGDPITPEAGAQRGARGSATASKAAKSTAANSSRSGSTTARSAGPALSASAQADAAPAKGVTASSRKAQQNRQIEQNRSDERGGDALSQGGLIGPVGYDLNK